ncbi:Protein of unknown function DUF2052 coiled-coil [Penicillium cf. griseofulvum]|uniref:CCD97-like C-terminal domain-containing protein n=1 Tax=Penicillium cf. griseofulvum TaxID=2972120 RepID=A0A9W9JLA1_9EURO|nr:Protein of unknown function DUF2052 coiled-coil [Penicillium cf. griseofulvum]KAJ5443320.1 Protein of unknown function DUF2052 coiled-coil [Penicillium cf. griseofulvum]KAJ5451230.1 Protein of unknown function DUF2052 coiled-coil [Penicillium cf. griseofulvum]
MPHFPKDSGFMTKDESNAKKAVTVKNRRKRYLDLHPEYFSAGLELADPLLYDRLIRRFQTAQEREAEGRAKGFSGVLETDLLRSEAKVEAISNPDPNAMMSYTRGPNGEILAEDRDEIPPNKEEGERLWRWEMGLRFMQGNDPDFDYKTVDQNEDYDDHSDKQDQYFEDEEPEWVVDGTRGDGARPNLQGETGIQDF